MSKQSESPRPGLATLTRRPFLAALAGALTGCAAGRPAVPGTGLRAPATLGAGALSLRPSPGSLLPPGWEPYVLRRDLPPTRYTAVERDGRDAIHASGQGVSAGLRHALRADPAVQRVLRWQWRVDDIHPGMSVGDSDTDDSPARLVVAFDGDLAQLTPAERAFYDLVELVTGQQLPYATLMYVWDAQLAPEQAVAYARSRRIQYIVVESGPARAGQWLSYERNVDDDFRRVFGHAPPGGITSLGLLTDSDDLKVDVDAWYADIGLYAS